MKRRRILLLVHADLVPPHDLSGLDEASISPFKTEYDVRHGLEQLGHEVEVLGLRDELAPLRRAIRSFEPHVAFNLIEEFRGEPLWDHAVVSYLQLSGVPVTGCGPRGLILSRDKALSKKIVHYHRVPVPQFAVFPIRKRFKRPAKLAFPVIVKSLVDDASVGIAQASIVYNEEKLEERVRFVHENNASDAIAEQFIEGREIYVGLLGNERLSVFPPLELDLSGLPQDAARIATEKVKFDLAYQDRHDIRIRRAKNLTDAQRALLERLARRIYKLLDLKGYARVDFRIDEHGKPWFLEANPNPDIAHDEEFATAASISGISYEALLSKIVSLALR
ncbi:MAG: D-alanine--D-alanine ligase [Planctomycetes bacterium]|nr:D-alanine--D-alanine ligase [Planctomycetota bacterium]MCB9891832.1 D-alanine--D-alanine ligase [Planctomycetota bacterium]MCB9918688.1 D-alanine--D-alanine ligase [Planctomycetota bacterium]